MSAADETDHARGWLFAEGLLLEDRIARAEKMSEAELDEELRADGIDPARVPSAEALLAKATELAEEKARGTVDHARGWTYVEKLLAEDGAAETRAVAAAAPESAPRRAAKSPRRMRPLWLVAAVPGLLLTGFALMNGAAIVAILRGEDIRPDDTWLPWQPAPTPAERAAPARAYAFAACEKQQWIACEAKLDEARGIDPDGESAPRVVEARAAIEAAKRAPAPTDGPKPKPRPPP
jgi:hypothetical protein